MRRIVVGAIMMVAPVLAGGTYSAASNGVDTNTTCYEDMPCWNCAEMGNKICGPTHVDDLTDAEWEGLSMNEQEQIRINSDMPTITTTTTALIAPITLEILPRTN